MDQPSNPSDETPTIRSLSSRDANKDARQAFNLTALLVAELPDGRFALSDRGQNFYLLVDEPPGREEFRLYNRLLQTSRMNAGNQYYGEPNLDQLARDIRLANQPPRQRTASIPASSLKIELKI